MVDHVDHVSALSLRPSPPLRGWMFMPGLGLGLVDSTRGVERHGGMGKAWGKGMKNVTSVTSGLFFGAMMKAEPASVPNGD
jgi:hypothetical protein